MINNLYLKTSDFIPYQHEISNPIRRHFQNICLMFPRKPKKDTLKKKKIIFQNHQNLLHISNGYKF